LHPILVNGCKTGGEGERSNKEALKQPAGTTSNASARSLRHLRQEFCSASDIT